MRFEGSGHGQQSGCRRGGSRCCLSSREGEACLAPPGKLFWEPGLGGAEHELRSEGYPPPHTTGSLGNFFPLWTALRERANLSPVGGGSSSRTERKGPNPAGGPERWELESGLRERRQWAPRWAALAELCGPQLIPHTYMVDESRDKVHAGCGATMQLGARETNGG